MLPLRHLIGLFLAATLTAGSRPNIILIFTDDQGINDVGCYGSEIPTPNIDSLARDGLQLTNFYAASSICTPSRFGLLTGRNPATSQDQLLQALMFVADEDKNRGIQPGEPTFAHDLLDAGYHTALIGKWHLGHGKNEFLPIHHGFETFIGHTGGCIDFFTMTYGNRPDWYHQEKHVNENGYATELITDEAVQYIRKHKDSDRPFFLFLPYNAPHFGKGWDPQNQKPINIMQAQAADLKRVANIPDKVRREFAAMTVNLDDGIGRILKTLKQTNLEEDTLVVFMTDHGGTPVFGGSNLPLRGNKATLFDGGIKVPCLLRWPGTIPAGKKSNDLAWALDIAPTFTKLAGTRPPVGAKGLDLSPLWQRQDSNEWNNDRELFWKTGSHAELKRSGWSALRRGEWKLLKTPEDEFLFNLAEDPNEKNNLAPAQPQILQELTARRQKLFKQYRPTPPKGKLVIAGDSMTAAEGVSLEHGFPERLNRIGGKSLEVIAQGRSGWSTTAYLRSIDEVIPTIPTDTDWLLLQLGANDLRVHGHTSETVHNTAQNMYKLLKAFHKRAPNARLVLASPPMMEPEKLTRRLRKAGFNEDSPHWLAKLGEAYALIAKENNWNYIDLHNTLAPGETLDGAHANKVGHRRIATTIWQQLNHINQQ